MSAIAENLTKKVQQAILHEKNDNSGAAIKLYEEVVKEQIANVEDLTEEIVKTKE
jgi:hypothetical protein